MSKIYYLMRLVALFYAGNLYLSESVSVVWTNRYDTVQARMVFPGEPGFKKFLYNVSEIYINDSPEKSGLMYDNKMDNIDNRKTVLDFIIT